LFIRAGKKRKELRQMESVITAQSFFKYPQSEALKDLCICEYNRDKTQQKDFNVKRKTNSCNARNLRVSYFISNVKGRGSSSVIWAMTRTHNVVAFLSPDDGALKRK
jgi:hypothetical protein